MATFAAAAILIATGAFAAAQHPPVAPLPAAVQKSVAALDAQCREAGGRPAPAPELVKAADLTGDGTDDYVIDVNLYDCEGAASAMVNGQSGAGIEILVGGPGNTATSVYSNSVYGVKIETAGGRPTLWVDVAAIECGQRNADSVPFSDWQFCSRALVWNSAKRSFDFAPLAQKRVIQ